MREPMTGTAKHDTQPESADEFVDFPAGHAKQCINTMRSRREANLCTWPHRQTIHSLRCVATIRETESDRSRYLVRTAHKQGLRGNQRIGCEGKGCTRCHPRWWSTYQANRASSCCARIDAEPAPAVHNMMTAVNDQALTGGQKAQNAAPEPL